MPWGSVVQPVQIEGYFKENPRMPFESLPLPHFSETTRLILLAILQGVAEFLPISSSGHLNVFAVFLGGQPSTFVNIALHFGTLLSILVYYRKRILAMLGADRKVILLLIVGTIPAAVVGVVFKKTFSGFFGKFILTGGMLFITGLALCTFQPKKQVKRKNLDPTNDQSTESKKRADHGSETNGASDPAPDFSRGYLDLTWKGALFIGLFQAFALMPGISRSGFTILAGLILGMRRDSAAAFSFLLAIPAILGATCLEILEVIGTQPNEPISMVLVAALVAFVVGLAALALLVKLLNQGMLHWFALWVLPLGLVVIMWQIGVMIAQRAA